MQDVNLSQGQANCHTAEVKQNSVRSSEYLKIDVLQRNGGIRMNPRLGEW